jgi:DMSO/TMAO reductase YedYZ molybdopterin-dependent catalytic subunit
MTESTWLPPGQAARDALWVTHYGPVPRGDPDTWAMSFTYDAPAPESPDGPEDDLLPPAARPLGQLTVAELTPLGRATVTADMHCASKRSAHGLVWEGTPAAAVLDAFPPPDDVVGVLVYGEYGYAANVRISDLREPTTLLATHLDGQPLTPEHGWPVRLILPHLYAFKGPKWFRGWEYLTRSRRGFWEERGYHLVGDPWSGNRYSYQE